MKSLVFTFIFTSLVAIGFYHLGQLSAKHKNFDADRYAAEWGCLAGGRRACEMIANYDGMYGCMDFMTETYCPAAAKSFEEFLKQSL